MIYANKQNERQLIDYAMSISTDIMKWQIVTVRLLDGDDAGAAMERLMEVYADQQGLMFKSGDNRVVMLVRFGNVDDYSILQKDVTSKIPEYRSRVMVRTPTASGIQQLQIDFTSAGSKKDYFEERRARAKAKILLIDDDFFIRKTMTTALSKRFEVEALEGSEGVIDKYKEINPDMVLLDLHMPGADGWELLDKILAVDVDCYVVLLSADSGRANVLKSRNSGAVGFVTKPPEMKAINHYIANCPTVSKVSLG